MSCNAKEELRESSSDVHTNTAPSFHKRRPIRTLSRTSCGGFFEGQWTTFSYLWSGASSSTGENLRSCRRSYKPGRVRRKNRNEPNSRDLIRSSAQCASTNRYFCRCGGRLLASRCQGESKASIFLLSRSPFLLFGGSGYQHPLAIALGSSRREISAAGSFGHWRGESRFLDLAGPF